MLTRRLDFPASSILEMVNGTGATLAAGAVVDLGAIGYGILPASIAAAAKGSVYTEGRYEVPKANGVAFAQGEAVGWDVTNTRVQAATNGRAFGTLAEAALTADTVAIVNLNQGPQVYATRVVGSAAGAGLMVNTGFGMTPTGPTIVQVTDAPGAPRTISSLTWGAGADLGKLTIVTSAGAGTDIVNVVSQRS